MRTIMFALITVLLITFPTAGLAHQHTDKDKWDKLNQTSDKVLQLVKQEKLSEAKQLLQYFSEQFLAISYDQSSLSMNDLRVITTSYDQALEAVTSVRMSHEDRVMKATELRLVIDAVTAQHNPLWINTKGTILKNIDDLKETAKKKESQAFQHQFNHFLRNYRMIRPALLVSLDTTQMQRLDSQVTFLDRSRSQLSHDKLLEHLDLMETQFKKLYGEIKEDQADPSLLWVMFTMGGMIFASLSYVGYKKYKADKRKKLRVRQRAERK